MSDSPLISVIVPVYNTRKYLHKCLESICEQTYKNLEIICVNDGSTDGSSAILEEYAAKDSRIKIFTQTNAGLSAARNTGLNNSTGTWIAGVDSDDYLLPDTFEYALTGAKDDVDIICFGTKCVWEDTPEQNNLQKYFDLQYEGVKEVNTKLIKKSPVVFWNKLWRKSLIERYNCRFPTGLLYEDTYFYYALAPFARRIAYLPDKKYVYIQRSGSIMSETRGKSHRSLDRLHIARHTLNFFESHPLPEFLRDIRLIAFTENFFSNLLMLPDGLYASYINEAQKIAYQYNLIPQYGAKLRFLKRTPWYLKPFVRHSIKKSYYGFLGVPIITIIRHQNAEIFRLFGIKILKSFYKHQY